MFDDAKASEVDGNFSTAEDHQILVNKIKPSSYGMKRTYSTIDISADKWLLVNDSCSLEKLENPPSLAHGLSREIEKEIRYLGCELIQYGSILLQLPQTAAATGQILFQRYYYQKSFVRYNFEHTVMACLLLASKIEEEPRRARDVLNVYNRLKQLNNGKELRPMSLDTNYRLMKNLVIKAERRILNTLGFVVHVHHPHKLIYVYLNSLKLLETKDLLQKAWSYMNDGLRTDIFLRYKPETIACACIHLAARTIDEPVVLPKNPFPWFKLFDVSDHDVKAISLILMGLYAKTEVPKLNRLCAHVEKLANKLLKIGNETIKPVFEPEKSESCDKVRSIQKKFDQMKEVIEKKVEKRKGEEIKKSDNRRRDDNDYKDKRRNDRNRRKSRSRSPRKNRTSRSRSPNHKKYKHHKYDRKHR